MCKCALKPPSWCLSVPGFHIISHSPAHGWEASWLLFTVIHVKSPLSLTETEQMLPGVSESSRQTVRAVYYLGCLQWAWWGGRGTQAKAWLARGPGSQRNRGSLPAICSQPGWGRGKRLTIRGHFGTHGAPRSAAFSPSIKSGQGERLGYPLAPFCLWDNSTRTGYSYPLL